VRLTTRRSNGCSTPKPLVLREVDPRDRLAQLGQTGDLRHGHQMGSPEPADLTLDADVMPSGDAPFRD